MAATDNSCFWLAENAWWNWLILMQTIHVKSFTKFPHFISMGQKHGSQKKNVSDWLIHYKTLSLKLLFQMEDERYIYIYMYKDISSNLYKNLCSHRNCHNNLHNHYTYIHPLCIGCHLHTLLHLFCIDLLKKMETFVKIMNNFYSFILFK